MENQTGWPDQLFDVLKRADMRQVGYVPDAGHARLIERCKADNDIRDVVLSTEEEGIALAAGAWLGGQRAALLMQSSGVGNCINMLSLINTCRFPFLTFITMRGEWAEFNPWQVPMSQATEPVLTAMGVKCYRADRPGRRGRHRAGRGRPRLRRRLRGRGAALAEADRPQGVGEVMLERREAIATLMANRRKDLFVVPGLGSCTYDMASLGEKDTDFYLWGAMGGAAMIGLGLALAKPKLKVAVITGDGEMLMGMGSLATIGVQRPNESRGHRVRQPALRRDRHAGEPHRQGRRPRRRARSRAASRARSTCEDEAGLEKLAGELAALNETLFARVHIAADDPPRVLPTKDGVELKLRFRKAVAAAG